MTGAAAHLTTAGGVIVCSPVTCRTCGKTTWSGCGLHVEQALAGVPESERCLGHRPEEGSGRKVSRLLGRS